MNSEHRLYLSKADQRIDQPINSRVEDWFQVKRYGGTPIDGFSFGLCKTQKGFSTWYFNKRE